MTDHTTPEPGTLWLIGLVVVLWIGAGLIAARITGMNRRNKDD